MQTASLLEPVLKRGPKSSPAGQQYRPHRKRCDKCGWFYNEGQDHQCRDSTRKIMSSLKTIQKRVAALEAAGAEEHASEEEQVNAARDDDGSSTDSGYEAIAAPDFS